MMQGGNMEQKNLTKELRLEFRKIAYYYYISNMTQEEISKKMKMSRQRVNRILNYCAKFGIVKFTIEGLQENNLEIELRLEKKYNLKGARVVNNIDPQKIHEDLGLSAANFLNDNIADGNTIGFSRGRSVFQLVEQLKGTSVKNLTVTQLFGNENTSNRAAKIDEIVFSASKILRAQFSLLYPPVLVKNKEAKESTINEPFFMEAYKTIQKCDMVFVGIGTQDSQIHHVLNAYGDEEMHGMEWQNKLVGEICTYYYDEAGNIIDTPFKDRVIVIQIDDYLKIPTRVGIAGLPEKASAIRAAIEGGLINVIITDLESAMTLLE